MEPKEALYQAFSYLRSPHAMQCFLEDLCTPAELNAFASRLLAARQLADGLTYRQVAANTGLSTATVTRVGKEMRYGSGGYKQVLDHFAKNDKR